MKRSALVTARYTGSELERLGTICGGVDTAGFGVTGVVMPAADLESAVLGVEILVVEFEQVDAALLDAATELRILGCCRNEPAASVDIDAATEHGIPVLFTPGRNAIAVAEYTIGLMIAVSRNLASAHHLLRHTEELTSATYNDSSSRRDAAAQWSLDPGAPFARFQGPELAGRTIGIIGLGHVGLEIAARARAFGMRVVAHDPFAASAVFVHAEAGKLGLIELAQRSDFVVVAAKVTPESRGIVSAEFFGQMKPTAYFVNTARAALVDYEALENSLEDGAIAGAAIDVFPTEPLPADSRLRTFDSVVLSPHLAGASVDVVRHHSRQMTDAIERIVNGDQPQFLANPAVLQTRRYIDGGHR